MTGKCQHHHLRPVFEHVGFVPWDIFLSLPLILINVKPPSASLYLVECFPYKGCRTMTIWIETTYWHIQTCVERWIYFLWLAWAMILSGFLFTVKVKNQKEIWFFLWGRGGDIRRTDLNKWRIRLIFLLLLIETKKNTCGKNVWTGPLWDCCLRDIIMWHLFYS